MITTTGDCARGLPVGDGGRLGDIESAESCRTRDDVLLRVHVTGGVFCRTRDDGTTGVFSRVRNNAARRGGGAGKIGEESGTISSSDDDDDSIIRRLGFFGFLDVGSRPLLLPII